MTLTDATHDPALRSWVASRPTRPAPTSRSRTCRWAASAAPRATSPGASAWPSATRCWTCGWPPSSAPGATTCTSCCSRWPTATWRLSWRWAGRPGARLRAALSAALAEGSDQGPFLELCLVPQAQAEMAMPCAIRDYTDFYAGIHHAVTVGKLFRPDNPLLPNYKWVPIGYHGRASQHRPGRRGAAARTARPRGAGDVPVFGPSQRLDYELEVGVFVGPGNALGTPMHDGAGRGRICSA